jgi:hypothetical protein
VKICAIYSNTNVITARMRLLKDSGVYWPTLHRHPDYGCDTANPFITGLPEVCSVGLTVKAQVTETSKTEALTIKEIGSNSDTA